MRAIVRAAIAACLLSLISLIILSPALVLAADTGGPAFPSMDDIQAPPAVHNRSGLYLGLTAGAQVAQFETAGFQFSDTAWNAGVFAGYNLRLRSSPFVIGVEGDYTWTDISASPGAIVVATTHYLASVRARAGVGVGPAMFYATGGVAFTENKYALPGVSDNKFAIGSVFGAGVEAELTKALFLRLEALHYAFPDNDSTSCGPACLYTSKDQQTVVRVGVGFKLN